MRERRGWKGGKRDGKNTSGSEWKGETKSLVKGTAKGTMVSKGAAKEHPSGESREGGGIWAL